MKPQSSSRGEIPEPCVATGLRLSVSGISFVGYHGAYPEEREHGNPFEVDVEIDCSSLGSLQSDELVSTIDYQRITDIVRETSRRRRFNLIESLAGAIADALYSAFPMASGLLVRVSKLAPPGLGDVDRATAEVTRRKR